MTDIDGIPVKADDTLPVGLCRVVNPVTGMTAGYVWLTPPPIDAKFQEQVDRFARLLRPPEVDTRSR